MKPACDDEHNPTLRLFVTALWCHLPSVIPVDVRHHNQMPFCPPICEQSPAHQRGIIQLSIVLIVPTPFCVYIDRALYSSIELSFEVTADSRSACCCGSAANLLVRRVQELRVARV